MIEKLKRKFILVNMSLVSLLLMIVFIGISAFSFQRFAEDSISAMDRVIDFREGMKPPVTELGKDMDNSPIKKRMPLVPVFAVNLNTDGTIGQVIRENVSVTEDLLAEAVTRTIAQNDGLETLQAMDPREKINGVFWDLNLRYMVQNSPEGLRIAFADMSKELDEMGNLLITLFLVGLGGLACFLVITIYLAKWVLKPVERAWNQQKRFVADASHELKTPLTVILANMGILMNHKHDTVNGQIKWVEYTHTEAMRMKTLVEDLLFLAKSDSDTSGLVKNEINMSEALWSCLLPFESVAYERGVNMVTEIEDPIMVLGDEGQLKQLVLILADNACKYAGLEGEMRVSLKKKGDTVELKVNNTGEPIPKEELDQIFDRFYRVDHSRAREQGGYGLGLSIAQAIVKHHHGKMSVESDEKNGTTFIVHF